MEPQPAAAPQGDDYDFIMAPQKPQKSGPLSGVKGDPFIIKVVFLVGGAVLIMVVVSLLVSAFFGGKTNLETLVGIVQSEQEIIRLSDEGDKATSQEVKNAALNTQLTVTSHQQAWVAFLAQRQRTLKEADMNLKKNPITDSQLKEADQASVFDATYTTVMRSQLNAYAKLVTDAHKGATNKQERAILDEQYKDLQLLYKQWPDNSDETTP